ncbi:MAG: thioredoxin domain-containing protein, partial [Candidatus Limnocylindrales bacterium]
MARKEKTPGEAARRRRRQELRREQATTGSPDLAKSANKGAAKASAKPPEPAFWQSPTFLVTAAAIIATLVLIYVLNNKPNPPLSSLTPPANPVPASIPRSGTLLGVTTAPVRMDTWEDVQCPFCDIWTEQWEPHVIQDFVAPGIVQSKFNTYAFLGDGHDPNESLNAAVAALCAGDQGKFWEVPRLAVRQPEPQRREPRLVRAFHPECDRAQGRPEPRPVRHLPGRPRQGSRCPGGADRRHGPRRPGHALDL